MSDASRVVIPETAVHRLRHAHRPVVLTGAGVSAESGVPTFREAQRGLWAQYDPQALATPAAFRRDPALVWSWYAWRRELVAAAAPNPAHHALAQLANRRPELVLITQNVDGLHQRAGSASVIELHGNLTRIVCSVERRDVEHWDADEAPPRCVECGAPLRPDVVWFGENLPANALRQALAATRAADLFISVGTSTLVEPAASLPFLALEAGAPVIEVNPAATPLTRRATVVLRGPAGVILPAWLAAAWPAG